jgi:nitroimidazol reductase NimA-like FMN-containing flavoprotein (pyridoxamine 5'-phosphate oxidase superfamily)
MKIFNGAPGLSPKLSQRQIDKFLLSGKMNLQFGTIDEKKEPNIHPVWYVYKKGRFYFATETKSKKIKNIKRNSIAYFSVANENEPFIGVRGKGKTRIITDRKINLRITNRIITKYLGEKTSRLTTEVIDEIRNGLEVVVEIKPNYFSAWTFKS